MSIAVCSQEAVKNKLLTTNYNLFYGAKMKKILLMEPDREQAELFGAWLKEESYGVSYAVNPGEIQPFLTKEKFDILLLDIDEPRFFDNSLKLAKTLKVEARFKYLPIAVLVYASDAAKIIATIEAGVDLLMFKPFETESFSTRLEELFKEIALRAKGKKVLDLNYINCLIDLTGKLKHEGFSKLAPVIFNKTIIENISNVLDDAVIAQIIKRVNETIGKECGFMSKTGFSDGKIFFSNTDETFQKIPIAKLTVYFRNYIYAFIHLVRTLTSDVLVEKWSSDLK